MMTFILASSIVVAFLFIYAMNPLSMSLLIITQTLILAFALYLSMLTSWFSFIILMVFISGMMIIFTYISALASNDLVLYSPKDITAMLFLYSSSLLIVFSNKGLNLFHSNLSNSLIDWTPLMNYKIYSPLILLISITLFIYMLVSMIVVIKNSSLMKGPLSMK